MKIIEIWVKYGKYIGYVFTAFVVALLIYGHVFAKATIPQGMGWAEQPGLHICDTAPAWAQEGSPDLDQALDWWAERGWTFSEVRSGPCPDMCTEEIDGQDIDAACMDGWVTLDLRGQWWEPGHVGVCVRSGTEEGGLEWSAIRVPSVIEFGDATTVEDLMDLPMTPADAKAKVLAHEMGHCLPGLQHALGPPLLPGVRLNSPTGNVMNPSVVKGGWDDEGVPHGDW